ncbi:MAG: nucleotide exchange factor GrpE [Candidatus Paceibacterota bacterium]
MPEEDITIEEESAPDLIKKLREDLKKCNAEKQDYLAGWQRAKADFVNARREEEERRADFAGFVEAKIINDFLPVLDSLEIAIKDKDWQTLDKTWQDGIKCLHNQFVEILKGYGVEEIKALGDKFDPSKHESVGEISASDEKEDGIVAEEMRKGYKLKDKIIRAVQVKINKYNK